MCHALFAFVGVAVATYTPRVQDGIKTRAISRDVVAPATYESTPRIFPKAGQVWATSTPSVLELAVHLNTTVYECGGDVILGGELPAGCLPTSETTCANGKYDAGLNTYLYTVGLSDGPATIYIVDPATTYDFEDSGLRCTFSRAGPNDELLGCFSSTFAASSYHADGTSTIHVLVKPTDAIQNTATVLVALLALLASLDASKRLTDRQLVGSTMSRARRSLVGDVTGTVALTAAFKLLTMGAACMHPYWSTITTNAMLGQMSKGLLVALAVNAVPAYILMSPTAFFASMVPNHIRDARAAQVLCRLGYEVTTLIAIIVVGPDFIAIRYHSLFQFCAGFAIVVLTGRDACDIMFGSSDRRVEVLAAGLVAANALVGVLFIVPTYIAIETIPPGIEVMLAVSSVVQAFAVGAICNLAVAART
jgi:hypothetical protein